MPRIIIFAGAPEADWSAPEAALASSSIPSAPPAAAPLTAHATSSSTSAPPAWRSLPLHRAPLHTGFSQPHGLPTDFRPPAHFFSVCVDVDSQPSPTSASSQELLSHFYDHSLALHHNLASSQLPLPPSQSPQPGTSPPATGELTEEGETSFAAVTTASDSSFMTTATDSFLDTTTTTNVTTTTSSMRPPPPPPPLAATSHHLSDLEDIPPGPELLRLAPQTVTVNLIAGVISVSPARAVTTRWGTELALVEVLVGDETRAGFGVTFWLAPGSSNSTTNNTDMRFKGTTTSTTTTTTAAAAAATSNSSSCRPDQLRRQDVVLLQNVALHVFRGKVYGQSLRKGLTRTTVLYRRRLREGDQGGYYSRRDLESAVAGEGGDGTTTQQHHYPHHPQLAKTRRVWDWVLRFVGGEERPAGDRAGLKGRKRRGWDLPPDDTQ